LKPKKRQVLAAAVESKTMATAKQTRPNQAAKWRDSLKPGDFSGIRGRIDNLAAHTGEYANRSTGLYTVGVLLGRSGMDVDSLRTLDFSEFVQALNERPSKEDLIGRYKEENPQYANVSNNRIITMKSKPKVEFDDNGEINLPSDTKTLQTMIKDFVGDLKQIQRNTLTIKNIQDLVQNSGYSPSQATLSKLSGTELNYRGAAKQRQTPLLASILQNYIKNPGKGLGLYPMQVVPSTADLPKKYSIAVANSIAVDFGEVIGPVALITGNATGNAARIAGDFLGADTAALMKGATIHFNAGATDPLYDSFIQYGDKVIGISSKGHSGGGAASAGTSMSSLSQAINEVKANPTAVKLLQRLLADAENRTMFDIVSELATISKKGQVWEKTLRMLQLLDQNYTSKDMYSDIRHIRSLGSGKNTNTRDADARTKTAAARALTSGLSAYIRDKMNSAPDRRKEDRSAFAKFLRATNDEITKSLNSNPKFSEICSWILNHSATVQIDLYTGKTEVAEARRPAANYGDAMVLTNIVATWPSTRVDTIELLENNKDLRFMLGINGYAEKFPDRSTMPFVDTDFKDMIAAKATDRDGSNLKTAADWAQSGVRNPRTSTDLYDLPKNTADVYTPQPTQSQPATKVATKRQQTATAAATSGALAVLNDFLASRNLTKARQAVDFAFTLIHSLDGSPNGDLAKFIQDFKTLLSNPVIMDLAVHGVDAGVLNEASKLGKFREDNVPAVISLIYWSLLMRQYVVARKDTTTVERHLRSALSTLSDAAELTRNLDRAINSLKQSSAVAAPPSPPQTPSATQPAPSVQQAPAPQASQPAKLMPVSAQYKEYIAARTGRMSPADRKSRIEAGKQKFSTIKRNILAATAQYPSIQNRITNLDQRGEEAQNIFYMLGAGATQQDVIDYFAAMAAGLRESSILSGITRAESFQSR
jgi:hypothetical protein